MELGSIYIWHTKENLVMADGVSKCIYAYACIYICIHDPLNYSAFEIEGTHQHTLTHTPTHSNTCTHTHMHSCRHTHTHTHSCKHTHTNTHTHTPKYTHRSINTHDPLGLWKTRSNVSAKCSFLNHTLLMMVSPVSLAVCTHFRTIRVLQRLSGGHSDRPHCVPWKPQTHAWASQCGAFRKLGRGEFLFCFAKHIIVASAVEFASLKSSTFNPLMPSKRC